MSTLIMGRCWNLRMPSSSKIVLISLADQANDDGVCWPAVGTISRRTCLSERTVQTSIAWLVTNGYMVINRVPGRSTDYQLVDNPVDKSHQLSTTPERGGAAVAPPGVQQLRGRGAAAAPRTVIEPSVEPRAQKFDASGIALPPWLDSNLWTLWVEERKDQRKPISQNAARLQIQALDEYRLAGISPKVVIEHCIRGSYQGLFPPKRRHGDIAAVIEEETDWWKTRGGVDKKAAEIGYPLWDETIPWPNYRADLRKHVVFEKTKAE